MTERTALDRLADTYGIEFGYDDIWGTTHRADREAIVALLRAMGCDAADDAAAERELLELERSAWLRVLPPVAVVRRSRGSLSVPLVVPRDDEGRRHGWRIVTESGDVLTGAVVPAVLPGGESRAVGGREFVRRTLTILDLPEPGYHRLEIGVGAPAGAGAAMRLIVAPDRCAQPPELEAGARLWGPTVQTYALRSAADWGAGDFGTLGRLVDVAAAAGANVVGVNPLHALFPARPAHASPYSPSSRMFLNPLYVDVESVPEYAECAEVRRLVGDAAHRARRAALRELDLIDWPAVSALKREALERLWAHFRERHLDADTRRGRAFRAFRHEQGTTLAAFATFEALEERFRSRDEACWGWPVWPAEYRRPEAPEVRAFAERHADRVGFFQYLQWLADEQLAAVGRRARAAGMAIGLYADMAVGADRSGFEGWWYQGILADGVGVGAPPDEFNRSGQDWGLPPMIPSRLRDAGYEPFIRCLQACMRHAGAVRLDHVMALLRLFWIPPGRSAAAGAYVRYPLDDLLGILALESVRNRCLVIGEDLGTVPDAVRERLGPLGVLSYKLLVFMKRDDGGFQRPAEYPQRALVAVTTHDLPTLFGWWAGVDIGLRAELGLFPEPGQRDTFVGERAAERAALLAALRDEGLLPDAAGEADRTDGAERPMTLDLAAALYRFAARTPCMVLAVQLEDVLGERQQVNLPGTVDEHPNWRRRLSVAVDDLAADPRLAAIAAAIRAERSP